MDRDDVIALLARHGLEPRKVLGQNFVVDNQVIESIIELAGIDHESSVLEVGPGLGALTGALATTARRVVAIEKDELLAPLVRDVVKVRSDDQAAGNSVVRNTGTGIVEATAAWVGRTADVRVITADALEVDWSDVLDGEQWTFVANLPYNVAVPIVMSILRSAPMVTSGLVMVQQEVAERLAAQPGGKTIGVPSIQLAWYADASVEMLIPPEVFHPVPNVSSALLSFRRHGAPSELIDADQLMAVVSTAYRKRRKMLRSSLGGHADQAAFESAGIEPTSRPENLSLSDWVRLTEVIAAKRRNSDDPITGAQT